MKKVIARNRMVMAFITVILVSILLYWGNTSIQTTQINIISEKIPENFDGFTIVQVSDLHNAAFGRHQTRLLNAVHNASPDIVAVTGDLIDSHHTDLVTAMEFINGCVKIAPVYYVTGNHEAGTNQYNELKQQLIAAGVMIINDDSTTITSGTESIQVMGLNDPYFTPGGDSHEALVLMDSKLKSLLNQKNEYTILLSHRPELFEMYAGNNIDLVLTGHAHGGQVRLPVIGGIVAPNQGFFPEYTEGVYEKEQTKMIVSRGLGNSIIPLRINNRPELVVVMLNN